MHPLSLRRSRLLLPALLVSLCSYYSSSPLRAEKVEAPKTQASETTTTTATASASGTGTKRPDPAKYAKDIAKFDEEETSGTPPPRGGIVFTGSSSVRMWKNLKSDFPDLPVLNRGFGGSVANDLIFYFDKVVLRYQPKLLVVYTGSNDINAKLTVDEAFADYTKFLTLVHEKLPETRVVVNAVKYSEKRLDQMEKVTLLNGKLEAWCKEQPWIRWIDTASHLLDKDGKPRTAEIYLKDKLHLNEKGYAEWKAILDPALREEWAKVNATAKKGS
ncbi:MAG: GDSL-type esterase/lipase family protein [Roseimicrobium sp.]